MKPRQHSSFRRTGSILLALSFAMTFSAVHAATQTWDNGTGDFTWNTTSTNWDGGSTWTNDNDAIFGASGVGTLINGGVSAHNLTFSSTGYLIQNDTLTLNGSTPTITTDTSVAATINSTIAGAEGLVKSGTGTLVLGGANNYTGATTISAGTLEVTRPTGYTTTSSGYDVAAGAAFTFRMPAPGYDMFLSSPLSGTGTVNLVNDGWSMLLDADNSAFAGTLTTSGNSSLFLKNASATSANAAYVIDMNNGGGYYGSLCTMGVASGSTIHLGSLSGTTPTSKISSGYNGSGTITWSIGALGTDTTFAGFFANYSMVTALTKVGSGTLTLTGANTYSGDTAVDLGTLVLRQQQIGGTITTASGAITEWQQTAPMEYDYVLQPGSVTFAGAGRVNKTGDFGMYGDHAGGGPVRVNQSAGALFDMQAGTFNQGSAGGFRSSNLGSLNVESGATIGLFSSNAVVDAVTGNGSIVDGYPGTVTLTIGAADHSSSVDNPHFTGTGATFSGLIANGTAGTLALTKTGSGTQTLTGANTYTGATTVNAGTLALAESATLASPTITVADGGVLALAGDATVAASTITLAEGGRLDTSGLTADFNLASGQNLSAGRTTGFAEDVKGNLVSMGSVHIAGTGSTAGTLTQAGNLTLGGGSVKFDLSNATTLGAGVNDLINVTGNLALSDSTTVVINKLTGTLTAGTYTLISCTGSLTGTAASNLYLDMPNLGRQSYALSTTAKSVVLSVTGIPVNLVWTGANPTHPTFWDAGTTANWSGIAGGKFENGDLVLFDDTAIATTVDVQGFVTPISVTFNNSAAKPYSLIGTGGIDGAASVTKNGDGMVTIASDNAYTGPTTLNAGTFNINSATALGTGMLVINGGVLDNTSGAPLALTTDNAQTWNSDVVFTGSNDLDLGSGAVALAASSDVSVTAGNLMVGGAISGAGPLSKSGAGSLTLSGANTYGGDTSVTAGTLVLRQQTHGGTITTESGATTEWLQSADMEWLFGLQPGCGIFAGAGRVNKTGAFNMYGDHASGGTFKVNQSPGALFDMQAGRFNQGGGGGGFIGSNLGSLNVESGATLGLFASNAVVDALTGSGAIVNGYPTPKTLTFGAADHSSSVDNPYFTGNSATFSGVLTDEGGALALIKTGSGTQILSGPLVGSYPTSNNSFSGNIIVNGGTLIGAALRTGSNTVFGVASNARTITVNAGAALEFQVPNLFGGHSTTSVPTLIVNEGTVTNADPWASNVINNGLGNVVLNSGTLTSTAGNGVIDDIDGTKRPGEVYGAWGLNGTVTSTGTSLISTSAAGVAGRVLLGSGLDTTFAVADGTLTVEAPLQAGDSSYLGGLIKTGAGKLVLAAANIYSSPTTVNEGTLELNGSLLASSGVTSPSNITVAPAATLSGGGTASGTLAAGGTLAPGTDGTGILSIGATTLTGTYACDIAGATADRLAVTGNLDLTGATLAVTELAPATNTRYVIATYSGSLTGSFASVPAGYSVDATGTPNQIILVKEGGGFGAWVDGFPGLTDKTPAGDPDKDGISNLLEYVIGGDPQVSSTSYLPSLKIVGTDLVLSYKRSDASETDTSQTGQWSSNLSTWNDIAPLLVNENDSAADDMTISIPLSNAVGGKLFGRLQVTKP